MKTLSAVNPYFFVVDCPHSGNRAAAGMIDAHPPAGDDAARDSFIPRIYERRAGLTAEGE